MNKWEDTKRVNRTSKWKKGRQYNDHNKKEKKNKRTNNGRQKAGKDTNSMKTGGKLKSHEGLVVPAPLVAPIVLLLNDTK